MYFLDDWRRLHFNHAVSLRIGLLLVVSSFAVPAAASDSNYSQISEALASGDVSALDPYDPNIDPKALGELGTDLEYEISKSCLGPHCVTEDIKFEDYDLPVPETFNTETEQFGATRGDAQVSASGSFSYGLQFSTPPGRQGIQPSLGLAYSSNSGQGRFGVGTSLTGMSSIRRCSKSAGVDGKAVPVRLQASDGLCLDGEALVKQSDSSYQEYFLEHDDFSRVRVTQSEGDVPLQFERRMKSGRILIYGALDCKAVPDQYEGTCDALVWAGGVPRVWMLKEVRDRHGNYVEYSYHQHWSGKDVSEIRPERIEYTGHRNSAGFDLSPRRFVEFDYVHWTNADGVPTKKTGLVAGHWYSISDLISTVTTGVGTETHRQYRFSYTSQSNELPTLTKMQECDGTSTSAVCKHPTTFEWQFEESSFDTTNPVRTGIEAPGELGLGGCSLVNTEHPFVLDLNGDGFEDFLFARDGYWNVVMAAGVATSDVFLPVDASDIPAHPIDTGRPLDYDQDGRQELLLFARRVNVSPHNYEFLVYDDQSGLEVMQTGIPMPDVNRTSSFWGNQEPVECNGETAHPLQTGHLAEYSYFPDLNGDGFPELVSRDEADGWFKNGDSSGDDWTIRIHDGSGWGPAQLLQTASGSPRIGLPWSLADQYEPADTDLPAIVMNYDGDAADEILIPSRNPDGGASIYIAVSLEGDEVVAEPTNLEATNKEHDVVRIPIDYNGDGLHDIIYGETPQVGFQDTDCWEPHRVLLNRGDGFDLNGEPMLSPSDLNSLDPMDPRYSSGYDGCELAWGVIDTRYRDLDFDGQGDLMISPASANLNPNSDLSSWAILRSNPSLVGGNPQFDLEVTDVPYDQRLLVGYPIGDVGPKRVQGINRARLIDAEGDGVSDLLQVDPATNEFVLYRSKGSIRPRLKKVTEGVNQTSSGELNDLMEPTYEVEYGLATHEDNISSPSSCSNSVGCRPFPWLVAKTLKEYRVAGKAPVTIDYSYSGMLYDRAGRGFRGFSQRKVYNHSTSTETIEHYKPGRVTVVGDYRRIYNEPQMRPYLITKETWLSNGNVRSSRVDYYWKRVDTNRDTFFYYPYQKSTLVWDDINGRSPYSETVKYTVRTVQQLGDYGAEEVVTIKTGGGVEKRTLINRYWNNRGAWLIAKPWAKVIRSERLGESEHRAFLIERDLKTGGIKRQFDNPFRSELKVLSKLERDELGNPRKIQSFAEYVPVKVQLFSFVGDQIFPTASVNGEWLFSLNTFDPHTGRILATEDSNGLRYERHFDSLDRLKRVTGPQGELYQVSYREVPDGSTRWNLEISYNSANLPNHTRTYNHTGQMMRAEQEAPGGETSIHEVTYDNLGRPLTQSRPYFSSSSSNIPVYQLNYDELGRLKWHMSPEGHVTTIDHEGLSKTVTNPRGNSATSKFDETGQLRHVSRQLGTGDVDTAYSYGPFGILNQITDDQGNIRVLTSDAKGRYTSTLDPDAGQREYTFSGSGELVKRVDGKTQTIDLRYDKIGRVTEKIAPEGTSVWEYDTAANGQGRLHEAISADGVVDTYHYDQYSRVKTWTQRYDQRKLVLDLAYDTLSRVESITYPQIESSRPTVRYNYDGYGNLAEVTRKSTGDTLWKATDWTPDGRVAQEIRSNGVEQTRSYDPLSGRQIHNLIGRADKNLQEYHYEYDANGNLRYRLDMLRSVQEAFRYDDLDRVVSTHACSEDTPDYEVLREEYHASYEPDSEPTQSEVYAFAGETGFLGTLSDCAGDSGSERLKVAYDSLGNIRLKSDVGEYKYDQISSANPNGSPNAVVYTPGKEYAYDLNGNMIRRGRQDISYTSFNKIRRIVGGADGTATWSFDASDNRVLKQTDAQRLRYLGAFYVEEESADSAEITKTVRVPAVGKFVAEIEFKQEGYNGSLLETTVRQRHTQRLDAVTLLTDENGNVLEERSYDVFGKQRSTDWFQNPGTTSSFFGYFGFGEYERDSGEGLLNAGGRHYDPELGKFLQPDPVVSRPTFSEDLNRYSFAWNNPLKYGDPSGLYEVPAPAPVGRPLDDFEEDVAPVDRGETDQNEGRAESDSSDDATSTYEHKLKPRSPEGEGDEQAKDAETSTGDSSSGGSGGYFYASPDFETDFENGQSNRGGSADGPDTPSPQSGRQRHLWVVARDIDPFFFGPNHTYVVIENGSDPASNIVLNFNQYDGVLRNMGNKPAVGYAAYPPGSPGWERPSFFSVTDEVHVEIISEQQFQQITAAAKRIDEKYPYSSLTSNCHAGTCEILNAAGINFPFSGIYPHKHFTEREDGFDPRSMDLKLGGY